MWADALPEKGEESDEEEDEEEGEELEDSFDLLPEVRTEPTKNPKSEEMSQGGHATFADTGSSSSPSWPSCRPSRLPASPE